MATSSSTAPDLARDQAHGASAEDAPRDPEAPHTPRATIDWYRRSASRYAQVTQEIGCFPPLSPFRDRFAREIPGAEILDAGCGGGRDALWFAARGARVTACDVVAEFLTPLQLRVSRCLLCDLAALSTDNRFDGIWCCAALHHLTVGAGLEVIGRFALMLNTSGLLFVSLKRLAADQCIDGRTFYRYELENVLTAARRARLVLRQYDPDDPGWISLLLAREG